MKEDDFQSEFGKRLYRKYLGFITPAREEEPYEPIRQEKRPAEHEEVSLDPFFVQTADSTHDEKNQDDNLDEHPDEPFPVDIFPDNTSEEHNPFEVKHSRSEKKPKESIDLHTISDLLEKNGVVGEKENGISIMIGLANNLNYILKGDAGTGKTYLMDTILSVFPGVYHAEQLTDQALWYDAERINESRILYINELQKPMAHSRSKNSSPFIDLIKTLSEGKTAEKRTTNQKRDGVDVYSIESKTIAATIANENLYKEDRELQRRFNYRETENSEEHIRKIIESKVSRRGNIDLSGRKETLESRLAERVEATMDSKVNVINPFLEYISQCFPNVKKVQAYADHYISFFDAIGRFFAQERIGFEVDGHEFIILNLEDVYNGYRLNNDSFMKTLKEFNEGIEFEQFRPDWRECFYSGSGSLREMSITTEYGTYNIKDIGVIDRWQELHGSTIRTTDYKTGEMMEIAELAIRDPYRLLEN